MLDDYHLLAAGLELQKGKHPRLVGFRRPQFACPDSSTHKAHRLVKPVTAEQLIAAVEKCLRDRA